MLSPDFAIRIMPGRFERHGEALNVEGKLVLYISATANASKRTFYLNLGDFAAWAGCSYRQAQRALKTVTELGWVCDVQRRGARGLHGRLGPVYQSPGEYSNAGVKVYIDVFGRRPDRDERAMIADQVGGQAADVRLWRLVCTSWAKERANPMNVNGLVDRFLKVKASGRAVLAAQVGAEPDYRDQEV